MNERTFGRVAPLAGFAYAIAIVASDLVIGPFPDSNTSLSDLSRFYAAHHAQVAAGGMIAVWGSLLFSVFGCALWSRLRADGAHPALSAAVLVATAAALVSDVQSGDTYWLLGHISTGHAMTPAALQAWHVAGSEGSFSGGASLFLLAVGVAGLAGRGVPRWLAWPALVLGVLQLTPFGFVASLLFLVWAAVTGIVLAARTSVAEHRAPSVAVSNG